VLVEAEASALNDTPVVGCRTLDVLHVAAAKLMGVTEFCTFDTRQSTLASRVGLIAVTP
jgi:predicted nucleic acid-binding protein